MNARQELQFCSEGMRIGKNRRKHKDKLWWKRNLDILIINIQVQVIRVDFIMIIKQTLIWIVICGHRETCRDSKGLPIYTGLQCCGPVLFGRSMKFLHPTEAMDINPRMFRRAWSGSNGAVLAKSQRLYVVLNAWRMRISFIQFLVEIPLRWTAQIIFNFTDRVLGNREKNH